MEIRLMDGPCGLESALLGMGLSYGLTSPYDDWESIPEEIKERLKKVATKLASKGGGEDKFLRQICYWWDINAPSYWWPQFDQYKIGVTTLSASKMHSLTARPFSPNDFELEGFSGWHKVIEHEKPTVDEDAEEWCQHPQYDVLLVSSQGRIKRKAYTKTNTLGQGRRYRERIYTLTVGGGGYLMFILNSNKESKKHLYVHRVVAETFIPNPENKPQVNHINGNKLDNRIENLEWVTAQENAQKAVELGTKPINYACYQGKFTQEERDQIMMRWEQGETVPQIARDFGVYNSRIYCLVHGIHKFKPYENEFKIFCKKCVEPLNALRDVFLETKDNDVWMQILGKLPQAYKQRRVCSMNLAVMKNIYHQRKNHKLEGWHTVCDAFVEATPEWLRGSVFYE